MARLAREASRWSHLSGQIPNCGHLPTPFLPPVTAVGVEAVSGEGSHRMHGPHHRALLREPRERCAIEPWCVVKVDQVELRKESGAEVFRKGGIEVTVVDSEAVDRALEVAASASATYRFRSLADEGVAPALLSYQVGDFVAAGIHPRSQRMAYLSRATLQVRAIDDENFHKDEEGGEVLTGASGKRIRREGALVDVLHLVEYFEHGSINSRGHLNNLPGYHKDDEQVDDSRQPGS